MEGVDRLNQWVRHLLFALKPITPTLVPADLNRVVAQALGVVRPTLERRRIRVELNLAEALPLVPLDDGYFEQAFIALLTNACEATPQEGRIGIVSRLMREGQRPTGVAVELTDNGEGIPPGVLQQVFVPYFTTKSDGVGLGLTMAQKIVSAHGGSLTVSNHPEGGAAVQILLPFPYPPGAERNDQDSDH